MTVERLTDQPPELTSHTPIEFSKSSKRPPPVPVTTRSPSGLNATLVTSSRCSLNSLSGRPVVAFQSMAESLMLPVTITRASGLYAIDVIALESSGFWERRTTCPVCTSNSRPTRSCLRWPFARRHDWRRHTSLYREAPAAVLAPFLARSRAATPLTPLRRQKAGILSAATLMIAEWPARAGPAWTVAVEVSHTRRAASSYPASISRPSALTARLVTGAPVEGNACATGWPLDASQTRSAPSAPPDTTRCPSGVKAAALTGVLVGISAFGALAVHDPAEQDRFNPRIAR